MLYTTRMEPDNGTKPKRIAVYDGHVFMGAVPVADVPYGTQDPHLYAVGVIIGRTYPIEPAGGDPASSCYYYRVERPRRRPS